MAETNLAVIADKETRLAILPEYTDRQIQILAETIAKDCDQAELGFFINVCRLKRLDPFSGQVHAVKRWDSTLGKNKMTIQVGIDGFRVIAARTNDLAGITEPEFDSEEEKHPNWARVTVYRYGRNDEKIPFTAKARYDEYVQTKKDGDPNHMWATKPYIMLGKCAEALALRKAFPDELAGMYAEDEMGQADNLITPAQAEQRAKKPVTQPQAASAKQQVSSQKQEENGLEVIKDEIENSKIDGKGQLWLSLKKCKPSVVVVRADKIDGDMKPGMYIEFRGLKMKHATVGDYYDFQALIELMPIQEAEVVESKVEEKPAEIHPEVQGMMDDVDKMDERAKTVDELKASGAVKTASSIPEGSGTKPGTIGKRRAQRLYTIAGKHKAENNNFTEAEMKRILGEMHTGLEHMSDLPTADHDKFEKWANGEEDWRRFWES